MALPLATVVVLSLSAQESVWPHLIRTVLPGALADTGLLLAGVATLTLLFGTGTAWLVTMYRFPGRGLLDRLLVLPLAMPTYIVAYCYVELLDFSGPVQRALRALFGWHTVKDYWFPDVRTLTGAILVLSAVLYPYVYLSARASFVQQSVCVLEVARTLGRTSAGAFWSVALPLARPALAAGVALALMEMPERPGRRAVPGRVDPDGQHLRHLAAALQPGGRGADRAGGAAVRAGAAGRREGRARARASSTTRPGAIAPSPSPTSRAGAATRPRRCAACR